MSVSSVMPFAPVLVFSPASPGASACRHPRDEETAQGRSCLSSAVCQCLRHRRHHLFDHLDWWLKSYRGRRPGASLQGHEDGNGARLAPLRRYGMLRRRERNEPEAPAGQGHAVPRPLTLGTAVLGAHRLEAAPPGSTGARWGCRRREGTSPPKSRRVRNPYRPWACRTAGLGAVVELGGEIVGVGGVRVPRGVSR